MPSASLSANGLQAAPPSTSIDTHKPSLVSGLALAAAVAVLAMFAVFLATGIGQDSLQFLHPPQEYRAILLRNPPVLRLVLGLDNAFIMLYASMFLLLATALWRGTERKAVLAVACGLLGVAALLDLLENMHFLTMLAAAEQGFGIGPTQIALQVWESLVKFHASYLGLFLLGFVLPNDTGVERSLCFALRWVQLPIGLLIYLTPREVAVPLVLVRFTFFFLALLALVLIFRPQRPGSDEPA